MSKKSDLPLFEKSILHIVNGSGGIKLLDLIIPMCAGLNDEGYQVAGEEIENLIYTMIETQKISEVSYMIKGRTRSFLLPRNTTVSGNAILDTPGVTMNVPEPTKYPTGIKIAGDQGL